MLVVPEVDRILGGVDEYIAAARILEFRLHLLQHLRASSFARPDAPGEVDEAVHLRLVFEPAVVAEAADVVPAVLLQEDQVSVFVRGEQLLLLLRQALDHLDLLGVHFELPLVDLSHLRHPHMSGVGQARFVLDFFRVDELEGFVHGRAVLEWIHVDLVADPLLHQ